MFKRSTFTLGGAALCGALLVSGCANQMSQRSDHEERVERKLLEHTLQIDVGEPKVMELPQRRVRVHEQKRFEVTEFEVTRRYDRYTPYQPWREIYEIPLGAVAVVAGVGANVVNVFALGNLPGILGGLFNGGGTRQHDQVGHRDLFTAIVEVGLNLLQRRQHLVYTLVCSPVLLRRQAQAGAIGTTALVGATEGRGRCPGGGNQLAHAQARS